MCFCAGTLPNLGLSWINKYDNKTASRWKQVPVLINDLLNHSYQTIRMVAEKAQLAANRKNSCKLRKQLHQFDNTHAANAHNTTKQRSTL